jgi:7-keto-8-aminopelargonate synthetase-like enzyme
MHCCKLRLKNALTHILNVHVRLCSLFSMDGDFALLAELVALRKQHEFLLVIDEVFGIPVSWFYTPKDLSRHNVGAT